MSLLHRLGTARRALRRAEGQSTVEAAFLIPFLLGGILLLVQPGIILYDRMVMSSAAAQACRLMVTLPEGDPDGQCRNFVMRRLAAVPQQDCFHVHDQGCTWEVSSDGGASSDTVKVCISTAVRPLPLVDVACRAVGLTDGDGLLQVKVERSMRTQPDWALTALGGSDPESLVGAWLS